MARAAGDDGGWSLGDALDDAGHVLEVIGGIALIALAILLPLSLIAALAAFAISRGAQARTRASSGRLTRPGRSASLPGPNFPPI